MKRYTNQNVMMFISEQNALKAANDTFNGAANGDSLQSPDSPVHRCYTHALILIKFMRVSFLCGCSFYRPPLLQRQGDLTRNAIG